MNLIFLCFDICNYICHDTSDHFSALPSEIFFIFSSTLVLTSSYRRSLYTFYKSIGRLYSAYSVGCGSPSILVI